MGTTENPTWNEWWGEGSSHQLTSDVLVAWNDIEFSL